MRRLAWASLVFGGVEPTVANSQVETVWRPVMAAAGMPSELVEAAGQGVSED